MPGLTWVPEVGVTVLAVTRFEVLTEAFDGVETTGVVFEGVCGVVELPLAIAELLITPFVRSPWTTL